MDPTKGSCTQLTVTVVSRCVNRRSAPHPSAPGASLPSSRPSFRLKIDPAGFFPPIAFFPSHPRFGLKSRTVSPAAASPPFVSVQVGTGGVFSACFVSAAAVMSVAGLKKQFHKATQVSSSRHVCVCSQLTCLRRLSSVFDLNHHDSTRLILLRELRANASRRYG